MATRFLAKLRGADDSTAIANDATGLKILPNLPSAAGIAIDKVDNIVKYNQNGAIVELIDAASTQTISGDKTFTGTVVISGVATKTEFADGAVGAPSITFTNDLTTGIYRIGASNIGVTLGGTKVYDLKTTGLTISAAGVTSALTLGAYSASSAGVGLVVTPSVWQFSLLCDDNSTGTTAGQALVAGRTRLLTAGASLQGEHYSLHSQVKVIGGNSSGYSAGILSDFYWGAGTTVSNGVAAGFIARLAGAGADLTISSGKVVSGFCALRYMAAAHQGSGLTAGYSTFIASTENWDYGVYMPPLSVDKGIAVGNYSSTVGDGIPASGSTWINGFFSDVAADLGAGVRRNVIARTFVNADQTTAASDYSVIRAHLKSASGVDYSGDTSVKAALHAYCEQAGATIVGAGSFFTPVLGELWSDGDLTGTGLVGGVMSRIYTSAGTVSGTVAGVVVCKQFSSTQTFTHGLYIQAGSVATGMDISLASGATFSSGSAAPTHNALNGSLYLRTGQTDAKAIMYLNTSAGTGNTWTLLNTVIA